MQISDDILYISSLLSISSRAGLWRAVFGCFAAIVVFFLGLWGMSECGSVLSSVASSNVCLGLEGGGRLYPNLFAICFVAGFVILPVDRRSPVGVPKVLACICSSFEFASRLYSRTIHRCHVWLNCFV